jgi:penicillin-binding protein 1B
MVILKAVWLFTRLIVLAAVGGLVGLVVWAWWQYPLPEARSASLATVRLYAGKEELAVFQGSSPASKVWVPLAQIPQPLVDAVLVTEDRRFFHHGGIDPRAIVRAGVKDLWHGGIRQGGSTITQQLARTLFLGTERTWQRKVRESLIALILEARYSKQRILEAYLNSVYLGTDAGVEIRGFGAAARHYLHKDLRELRLEDAALLAASISAPNRVFSGDPARALAARNTVLSAMGEQGAATETAVREAQRRPLTLTVAAARVPAPYFVQLARSEILRRVELPDTGEVRLATTLDLALQHRAEATVREALRALEARHPAWPKDKLQAALVAIEPATGAVRALIGGRQNVESPFNRATQAARQPGSAFKPIVYLSLFESAGAKATPASLIPDEPTTIQSGSERWTPQNIDRRFRGPVTVRRALEDSLNVPAARAGQDAGIDQVVQTAQALGIESPLTAVPSIALGTSDVTLLELTAAYATIANQGIRVTPTALMPEQNRALAARLAPPPAPVRAASAVSSFLITHILRGVMQHGTARSSARWGLSEITAGKTGTTDRDAWFVGYTPDLAIGVWVGMDDGTPLGLTGAQAALPIWAAVMRDAVHRKAPGAFAPPPGVVFASVDPDTGRAVSAWCGGGPGIEEAFRAGTVPPTACADLPLVKPARKLLDWFRNLFQ